ncbi:hypothetical protein ACHAXA_008676 [Cyclostephanos tholiformis]|uniref:Fucosyltransferase n=1 Tax=Cyclostephanos tholiformis TaxID=382380 RepID=A0ABD3RX88_9STRA
MPDGGWRRPGRRGLPRTTAPKKWGSNTPSPSCAIAILTVLWSMSSLRMMSMNIDFSSRSRHVLGWWSDDGDGGGGRGRGRDDVVDRTMIETMRSLISSTPVQVRYNITISGGPHHMVGYKFDHCEVSCNYVVGGDGGGRDGGTADPVDGHFDRDISLTMESIANYPEHDYATSKRDHRIVMNTQLISDIPMHYNNWDYQYLRPIEYDAKPEITMASAFVSNCGAKSFRMRAIEALRMHNVTIEQYGKCDRTRAAHNNDKSAALSRHVFTLAFENSEEEDYVTEKFFQAYEAGTIPVYLGAPNVDDYAPMSETYLHLRDMDDVPNVANRMHEIANDPELYRHYLRYKTLGLSDKFLALTDMTVPHTFCQACYAYADDKNDQHDRGRTRVGSNDDNDDNNNATTSHSCRMTIPNTSTTVRRYYVRERTQFVYRDLFVTSKTDDLDDVTYDDFLANLHDAFRGYRPTWTYYRDEMGRNARDDANRTAPFRLRIYRICDRHTNVKTCLYSNDSPLVLRDDSSLRRWLIQNPCGELAVVFV